VAAGSVARLDVDVVGLVDQVRAEVPAVTDLTQKIQNQFAYLSNTSIVKKCRPIEFGDGLLDQAADGGMIAPELIGAMSQSRGSIHHFLQESIICLRHLNAMVKAARSRTSRSRSGTTQGTIRSAAAAAAARSTSPMATRTPARCARKAARRAPALISRWPT
jgi:hypothetical protein